MKAPESVLKGDIATVEVIVKADGFPGVDIPVTLERPGGSPLAQVGARTGRSIARLPVTFRVPMESLGRQDLTVQRRPALRRCPARQ